MPSKEVQLQSSEGVMFDAYLAIPDRVPGAGIVVLQEIFGVNGYIRGVCDSLASQGFVAIAPDLFWRQSPGIQLDSSKEADRNEAYKLYQGMDETKAIEDSIAALKFLRSSPDLCTGRVGALGYCLGGKLSYLMAARSDIDAAVSYYGVGISAALNESSQIKAPILLHVAGLDHLCPPSAQTAIIDALSSHGERAWVITYPQADHAFARAGGPTYRAADAKSADSSTKGFLEQHLT